jgi:Sulfotransferase family
MVILLHHILLLLILAITYALDLTNGLDIIELYPDASYSSASFLDLSYRKYNISKWNVLVQDIDKSKSYNNIPYSESKPTFIHIPKTGGTSVESVFVGNGVRLGQYAYDSIAYNKLFKFRRNVTDMRHYPVQVDSKPWENCSLYHIPPTSFVPKSFTIVREPFARYINIHMQYL